jgi:hypothetical protein
MESPSELNAKSESEKSNAQVSEPLALTDDGMKALVLAGCLERARQIIDAGTMAGQIEKEHLDFLEGLMRFCANAVRQDLGPATQNFSKERYVYLQTDLASLRRSFDAMLDSARTVGS